MLMMMQWQNFSEEEGEVVAVRNSALDGNFLVA